MPPLGFGLTPLGFCSDSESFHTVNRTRATQNYCITVQCIEVIVPIHIAMKYLSELPTKYYNSLRGQTFKIFHLEREC